MTAANDNDSMRAALVRYIASDPQTRDVLAVALARAGYWSAAQTVRRIGGATSRGDGL